MDANKTPLYEKHLAKGAKIVNFAGWQMPLHYGSQIEEHHQVRKNVGVFDISHMLAIDVHGAKAQDFLRYLLANDILKLSIDGKALYTCMLNASAGILDDLIVYRLGENQYRCIVNASTAQKDTEWMLSQAKRYDVSIAPRNDMAILAIQGPNTFSKLATLFSAKESNEVHQLKTFHSLKLNDWQIAKTGYTGETGVEIVLPKTEVVALWDKLQALHIPPIGLGARDSLRLEAGLNLYGVDMDETVNPDESNLTWTVDVNDPNRDFIGKEALIAARTQGIKRQLIAVILLDKGVCRNNMPVLVKDKQNQWVKGALTSGSFSPTLMQGIGLARVPAGEFIQAQVEIRGKATPAKIVKPPFVRNGKVLI